MTRAWYLKPKARKKARTAPGVVAVLENIITETGIQPTYVRCDNAPEFTAGALNSWCNTTKINTAFITPGSPWQNGFIESFNAQFRREQLSQELIFTMAEAKYLADEHIDVYNRIPPHGSLNGLPPNHCWEATVTNPNQSSH